MLLKPSGPVLVIDFGAQYAQLIARRVRQENIFSEIVSHTITADEVKAKCPSAIILSGGPSSVYAEGAPAFDSTIFDLGFPIFGICYGFQLMANSLGGEVAQTGTSEYGRTELSTQNAKIFSDVPESISVWMSHGDAVISAPQTFKVCAVSAGAPVAGFEDLEHSRAGVQFHPEVLHSEYGQK
ncbi:MAG: glutamine-hydrolyzing GMP synthase, partial [Candidatus Nanopelagicales bacterium]